MNHTCKHYQDIQQTLLRHEQTITQLMAIIASTNSKVAELAKKDSTHEKSLPVSLR